MKRVSQWIMMGVITAGLWSTTVFAEVPQTIGMPFMPKSETGEAIPDGTYAVTLRVLDQDEIATYEEEQRVTVEDGVANLAIGEGYVLGSEFSEATGGISLDVFDPLVESGERYVEVEFEGYLPQTLARVSSVPYAFYAARAESVALDAVTSETIEDGSIQLDDLSEEVVEQITGDFATRDELADEAAARIAGDNALQAAIAAITVETLGISFDDILGQIADDQVPDSFTRDVEVNSLVTSISGNIIQSGTVSETRIDSAIARDIEVNAAISTLTTTVNNSINAINYSQIQGVVDESDIDPDIARDTEITTALAAYLPLAGGTMTGNIAMASGQTVDGVDVGNEIADHSNRIRDHETRINALEGRSDEIADVQLSRAHGSIASMEWFSADTMCQTCRITVGIHTTP